MSVSILPDDTAATDSAYSTDSNMPGYRFSNKKT